MRAVGLGLTAGGVAHIVGVGAAWSTARIDGGHVDLPRLSGIMAVRSGGSSKNPISARAKRGQTRGWLPTGAGRSASRPAGSLSEKQCYDDHRLQQSISFRI